MRIHTNLLRHEIGAALGNSGASIAFHKITEHRSTQRDRAFDVRLEGTGGRSNTGLYGAGDYDGGTWDEWGAVFGALYELDPNAVCGGTAKRPVYADADDFHHQTGDRFKAWEYEPGRTVHMPKDSHPRHRWQWVNDRSDVVSRCAKDGCSAVQRR